MSAVLRAGAGSLLALSLVACGGGGGNADERAIEDMVEQFFQAFDEGDTALLASLFSEECGDMSTAAADAIAEYERLSGDDTEVEFDGVRIKNLTATTAEFLPQGTVTSEGQEAPLAGPDEEYTPAVKENGAWKITECELFL